MDFSSKSTDSLKNKIALTGLGALVVQFFFPMLFQGKVPFFRDFSAITYPYRYHMAEAFKNGYLPFWTTFSNSGSPFMALFHPGVFYPPSVLFLLPDFTLALNLFYVLHFVILVFPLYWLVRGWALSNTAAFCTAMTALLGAFYLSSVLTSNLFMGAIWLPAIFLCFDKWFRTRRGLFLGLGIFGIACQTLAACPEVSVLTVVMLGGYSLWGMPETEGCLGKKARVLTLTGGVVLALGLSALQLAPTYKVVEMSNRHTGWSFQVHSQWSMGYDKLSSFILPNDHSNVMDDIRLDGFQGLVPSTYMGIFTPVILIVSVFFLRTREIRFWFILFWVGVLLAMGRFNPLYEILYPYIPFLNKFRYPEKYFYLSTISGLFILAHGLDRLVLAIRNQSLSLVNMIWPVIVVAGLAWVIEWRDPSLDAGITLVFLGLFALMVTLTYMGRVSKTVFQVVFCLLAFLDLTIKDYHQVPLVDRKLYENRPLLMDILDKETAPYRLYAGRIDRIDKIGLLPNATNRVSAIIAFKEFMRPYFGFLYGVEFPTGLPNLALETLDQRLWDGMFQTSTNEKRFLILKRSATKYWVDMDAPVSYLDNYPVILPDRLKVFEDALPRAYMVPNQRLVEKDKIVPLYYDESFDPRREVLLGDPVEFQPSETFEGQVQSIKYRPNGVSIQTRQTGNGFLVLCDTWFPGWTLTVDGEPAPILRANHFYRGVNLGPGEHHLEFDYYPEGFTLGLRISAVSLVLLAGILLWRPRPEPDYSGRTRPAVARKPISY